MKEYIAGIIDSEGSEWLYEGTVKSMDIFIKDSKNPQLLSEDEAYAFAIANCGDNETPIARKME